MNRKLLTATLVEFAPIEEIAEANELFESTLDNVSCANCKYKKLKRCFNSRSKWFNKFVKNKCICICWSEKEKGR